MSILFPQVRLSVFYQVFSKLRRLNKASSGSPKTKNNNNNNDINCISSTLCLKCSLYIVITYDQVVGFCY